MVRTYLSGISARWTERRRTGLEKSSAVRRWYANPSRWTRTDYSSRSARISGVPARWHERSTMRRAASWRSAVAATYRRSRDRILGPVMTFYPVVNLTFVFWWTEWNKRKREREKYRLPAERIAWYSRVVPWAVRSSSSHRSEERWPGSDRPDNSSATIGNRDVLFRSWSFRISEWTENNVEDKRKKKVIFPQNKRRFLLLVEWYHYLILNSIQL